jgi:hypothetical protein
MNRLRNHLVYVATLLITGCALVRSSPTHLPYGAWRLGFLAPAYMEVWLETAHVEDVRGNFFPDAMSGTVAISYNGDPSGWYQPVGWGAGRYVTGAALPQRIYVRWQSLVEPQTYRAELDIPESARQLMLRKAPSMHPPTTYEYQQALAIGLAPGGWITAWIMSPTSTPIEILCQKAEIEPKGPYRGLSEGKYRPLSERAAPYVEAHPIPYDSWKCPGTTSPAMH